MGLVLTTYRYLPITSQRRYPMRHDACLRLIFIQSFGIVICVVLYCHNNIHDINWIYNIYLSISLNILY